MPVRIVTAAVLIALVLAALIAGSIWVYAAVAVVLGAGLIEYWQLTRAMGTPAPLWLLFPLAYALLLRDRLPSWASVTFVLASLAATSASARSTVSFAVPTAAPQRRRPSESFEAFGYLTAFWMSLTVINPFKR